MQFHPKKKRISLNWHLSTCSFRPSCRTRGRDDVQELVKLSLAPTSEPLAGMHGNPHVRKTWCSTPYATSRGDLLYELLIMTAYFSEKVCGGGIWGIRHRPLGSQVRSAEPWRGYSSSSGQGTCTDTTRSLNGSSEASSAPGRGAENPAGRGGARTARESERRASGMDG